jgi:hypothetical protein
MFTGLMNDFRDKIGAAWLRTGSTKCDCGLELYTGASGVIYPSMPRRTVKFSYEEGGLGTPHMAKVTIDRGGNTTLDTGTMTQEEIAAAASEFRRVANKLAHEASQMKKRAYREAKK